MGDSAFDVADVIPVGFRGVVDLQCVDAAAAVGGGEDDVWVDAELLAEAKLQSDYERE